MMQIRNFKYKLSLIFDNDLRTEQWENYLDYAIIGLITISTLSVFISTFNVGPVCEKVLSVIDVITVITFTVEVTLRIWSADALDERYKGFWGRIRYCFTFYGLIDVLSTYTFYVSLFLPLPYSTFKTLRVLRLLRVFRYMHSFRLLQTAISSKAKEMWVSLQFLAIVTLMLSFVLFFYEHSAQPEVYDNGFKSVVWAFAQYIGDPGGFADTPPITFAGNLKPKINLFMNLKFLFVAICMCGVVYLAVKWWRSRASLAGNETVLLPLLLIPVVMLPGDYSECAMRCALCSSMFGGYILWNAMLKRGRKPEVPVFVYAFAVIFIYDVAVWVVGLERILWTIHRM